MEHPPSYRQCAVWREVCLGKGNKEIAVSLGMSIGTVHSHMAALLDTLHLGNRTQLAVVGLLLGIIGDAEVEAMWRDEADIHAQWPRQGESCSPGR